MDGGAGKANQQMGPYLSLKRQGKEGKDITVHSLCTNVVME